MIGREVSPSCARAVIHPRRVHQFRGCLPNQRTAARATCDGLRPASSRQRQGAAGKLLRARHRAPRALQPFRHGLRAAARLLEQARQLHQKSIQRHPRAPRRRRALPPRLRARPARAPPAARRDPRASDHTDQASRAKYRRRTSTSCDSGNARFTIRSGAVIRARHVMTVLRPDQEQPPRRSGSAPPVEQMLPAAVASPRTARGNRGRGSAPRCPP